MSVLVGGQATMPQLPSQAEGEGADPPPPLPLPLLFQASVGWKAPMHVGAGDMPYSVFRSMLISSGSPSQTHEEIMFSQISGRLRSVRLKLK